MIDKSSNEIIILLNHGVFHLTKIKTKNIKMKKLLLITFIVMVTMKVGYSQPGGHDPAASIQKEIDGLTRELSLTKDQVEKVTPIVNAEHKRMSEAFAKMQVGGTPDHSKMQAERAKITAETDTQLKAVLTTEQSVKLDAYRKVQAEAHANKYQQQK
jgi:hypothetical protein